MKILLLTPPFTQLNTPYPATAYLKGFLSRFDYSVKQADLSIELFLKIFSKDGLNRIFKEASSQEPTLSLNSKRILNFGKEYLSTIDLVIGFLQNKNLTLAHRICQNSFLPKASRFKTDADLDWAFGVNGISDKARYFCTLYIEDLGDLIKESINPHFEFNRYAEKLAQSAFSFDPIYKALNLADNLLDTFLLEILNYHINKENPDVVGFTIPFPGNLYGGLKCARFIKSNFPKIKTVLGGGFVNTELRNLNEIRIFEYINYIILDDGEKPLLNLLEHCSGKRKLKELKRTFTLIGNEIWFINGDKEPDAKHSDLPEPDYSDLNLSDYISFIDMLNPMHQLWSNGRWNKMTLAHGCYWHKCAFCDITLDYINRFDPASAKILVDRIEKIIMQTGESGFHFVDEAAPPALLKQLALELISRGVFITWWTNIRFENAFAEDLCRLLSDSGCIAVSGGLEVASDRLLKKMNKGVTIEQAAKVCYYFSKAGIMVHTYLMYGFPTQTEQETIDSLEIVRQFFYHRLIQSAFWHKLSVTVHSDIGYNPEKYGITIKSVNSTFALNDLPHGDPDGCDHQRYYDGLNKALYNFMHDIGIDFPLNKWFDFKIPSSTVHRNRIRNCIEKALIHVEDIDKQVVWAGRPIQFIGYESNKKGKSSLKCKLVFNNFNEEAIIQTDSEHGKFIKALIQRFDEKRKEVIHLKAIKEEYEIVFNSSFNDFTNTFLWKTLRKNGLLLL